ncbi:MAG: hypothetical protein CYPHOPRED_005284 [Cyphobasidiales sp. Tagirdzhanova-0007]|nr:MAG: hypothetical protein CYPHOPRED_005284 [Cyphobasidiales sp. Tagirdzhanova-0007]
MEAAQNAAESVKKTVGATGTYISESVSGTTSQASKEANKGQAKDSNLGVGERMSSAGSAIGDKADETTHNAKADNAKNSIAGQVDDKTRGQESSGGQHEQSSAEHSKEGGDDGGKSSDAGPSTGHHGPHGVQAEIDHEIEKSGKHFDAPAPAEAPKEEGDEKKGNQPAAPPEDK